MDSSELQSLAKPRRFTTRKSVDEYLSKDKLECLICGKEYDKLGTHLRSHKVLAREYKLAFNIPIHCGLESPSLRLHRREIVINDPDKMELARIAGMCNRGHGSIPGPVYEDGRKRPQSARIQRPRPPIILDTTGYFHSVEKLKAAEKPIYETWASGGSEPKPIPQGYDSHSAMTRLEAAERRIAELEKTLRVIAWAITGTPRPSGLD